MSSLLQVFTLEVLKENSGVNKGYDVQRTAEAYREAMTSRRSGSPKEASRNVIGLP